MIATTKRRKLLAVMCILFACVMMLTGCDSDYHAGEEGEDAGSQQAGEAMEEEVDNSEEKKGTGNSRSRLVKLF